MDDEIRCLRERLVSLDAERRAIELELERLEASRSIPVSLPSAPADTPTRGLVTAESPVAEIVSREVV